MEKFIIKIKEMRIMPTSLHGFVHSIITEINNTTGSTFDSELYYRKVRRYIENIFYALGVSLKEFRNEDIDNYYGYRERKRTKTPNYIISQKMQTILKNKLLLNDTTLNDLPKKTKIEAVFKENQPYKELYDMVCIINEFLSFNFTNIQHYNIRHIAKQKVDEIADELIEIGTLIQQYGVSLRANSTCCLTTADIQNIVNKNRHLGNSSQEYAANILTQLNNSFDENYLFNLSKEAPNGKLSEFSIAVLKLLRYSDFLTELHKQVKFETRLNKLQENH